MRVLLWRVPILGERGFAQEQTVESIVLISVPQEARKIIDLALQQFGHGRDFFSINSRVLMARRYLVRMRLASLLEKKGLKSEVSRNIEQ